MWVVMASDTCVGIELPARAGLRLGLAALKGYGYGYGWGWGWGWDKY